MNPQAARMFIEQIINAPSIPVAQSLVESNLQALDTTFFQVLQMMMQEAQSQASANANLYMPDLPGFLADQLINNQAQAGQRLQALQMLYQYTSERVQQRAWQSPAAMPVNPPQPLLVTCPHCGRTETVLCPGFGLHLPAASVVAGPTGGICTLCQTQFNSVNCPCGRVIPLLAAEPDNKPMKEQAAHSPAPQQSSDDTSLPHLFESLKQQFDQEKNKGDMETARQSGLESIMERLSGLVNNESKERSLQEMVNERGKLDELMKEMLHRIEKPTYSGPALENESRAARLFMLLNKLKGYVANESMRQGKSNGETEKIMDLFLRLGHLVTYVHQTQGDEQQLISLEQDQARSLASEVRLYARRHTLTMAHPIWPNGDAALNPNALFYSGPDSLRTAVERRATELELDINPRLRPGADVDESRWRDLRVANAAIFDISSADPQVYYELGIALALGTELLLVAQEGTELPFDIAQNVRHYDDPQTFATLLDAELDGLLYGLQTLDVNGSSLAASVTQVEHLATKKGDTGLLHVALNNLRQVRNDPIQAPNALKMLNPYLGHCAKSLIYPRWAGVYSDPAAPRCFIIMPFREALTAIHNTIERLCQQARIEAVRGDAAPGQEIISSIWEEIGRATHITVDLTGLNPNVCLELGIADTLGRNTLLIAQAGTEKLLARSFPSIAKRRCHTYSKKPESSATFIKQLQEFLYRE